MPEKDSRALVPAARLRLLPLWVLITGLLMTAALGLWSFQREAAQRQTLLMREARDLAQALQGQVQAYIDTLPGLRVFGLLSQVPSDLDFARYAESISLQQRFPGLALTFLAEWVPAERREAFEATVRADRSLQAEGHPDFSIVPPGERPGYLVIRHAYPADRPTFGYDLFDPGQAYRVEVQAAIDTGELVATPPLRLARDREQPQAPERTSVVVRTALYSGGATPPTPAERRARVLGVAGVAFRTQPLVDSVLRADLKKQLRLRLLEGGLAGADPMALLYDSLPGPPPADSAALWTGRIRVADREWVLLAHPHSARAGQWAGQDSTWILLAFGAVLSLALAALTRGLAQANLSAEARLRATTDDLQKESDQLRESEARFRMLYENSFDAVLHTRPSGQVLAANAAACRLFGGTEAELQVLSRERLVDIGDERLPLLLAERERKGRVAGLLRMRRVDGSCFEAELSSNVYIDQDGLPCSSMIVRDVTERQRLAQRLQEKQRMESIGTLAGGVAHDFNNMLAGILGNLALAEGESPAGAPVQQRLQLARRAAERARALVRQILTFSRRTPVAPRVQALQPLVQEAVSLLQVTVPAAVILRLDLSAQPLLARVDGAQIQQLVLNLCTNAWQALAGQPGEVRVSLQPVLLPAAQAQALGLAPGDYVCLRVEDDGQGMDAATRERIFEPFFTTKPLGEGTGLGLAVVHGIVTESGGAVRVDSEPGCGASFCVFLPRQAEAALGGEDEAALPPGPAVSLQGRRVMYVDDDAVVSLTACAVLERAGLEVRCCSSGDEALAALRAPGAACELLVTDFHMPGMSGLELARELRLQHPDLRVVLISGFIDEALQTQLRTLGLREVLPKDEMLERLVDTVRRVLPPV